MTGRAWYTEGNYVVVLLVVTLSTCLYGISLFTNVATPVEPQSVFTLYGTVLGYLFGSREKSKDQEHEIVKERMTDAAS